jgi:hypothetical protein
VPVSAGRRYHAPQENGGVFAEPPLPRMQRVLAEGSWERSLSPTLELCGRPLREIRQLARNSALQAAQAYHAANGEPVPSAADCRILAAGHQPEIVHPGVWIKHFALRGLASAAGLTPLNLIVDNDTVKATSLPVPHWRHSSELESYRIEKITFDTWPGETPYEEYAVRNEEDFISLPRRIAEATLSWAFTPLINDYWAHVMRHAERTPLLGERLVAGRRALERSWGCHNLEVPVSRLCGTEAFAWFVAHLFHDHLRFHGLYNETVQEYRRVNGLRSRNHPVPNLATDGEWREMPLWAWRAGDRRRGRLFVRDAGERFELRVENQEWPRLPKSVAAFVKTWQQLHREGFKIRSRALTTTLFARLFIAEAFIHGIGGGKYDELTDELLRQFYGIQPPPLLVLSATLLLPFSGFLATPEQRCELGHELRDLNWNPQRHLQQPVDPRAAALAGQKLAILDGLAGGHSADLDQHRQLQQVTEELRGFVAPTLQAKRDALQRINAEIHANAILKRRDYAFCLYPEALLRPFCRQFLAAGSGGVWG